jgi:hypothetical protein
MTPVCLCDELLFLGAALHRARRRQPVHDRILHGIEVAGTDERLVLGGPETVLLIGEFALLQQRLSVHALGLVGAA